MNLNTYFLIVNAKKTLIRALIAESSTNSCERTYWLLFISYTRGLNNVLNALPHIATCSNNSHGYETSREHNIVT